MRPTGGPFRDVSPEGPPLPVKCRAFIAGRGKVQEQKPIFAIMPSCYCPARIMIPAPTWQPQWHAALIFGSVYPLEEKHVAWHWSSQLSGAVQVALL